MLWSSCDDREEINMSFKEGFIFPWRAKTEIEFELTEFFERYTADRVEHASISRKIVLSKKSERIYISDREESSVDHDFLLHVEIFTQSWTKEGQDIPYLEVKYDQFNGIYFSINDQTALINEKFSLDREPLII